MHSDSYKFNVIPSKVLGRNKNIPPSDKIQLAMIGTGSQGTRDMQEFLKIKDVQIVAVCDVAGYCDYSHLRFNFARGYEPAKQIVEKYYAEKNGTGHFKGCQTFSDYSDMLETNSEIDAVSVATTDHNHANATLTALKHKKHVYCQKPLAHSIHETRRVVEMAKNSNVATQMGNQGHAGEHNRLVVEWIRDGAIGSVHKVHVWTDRPGRFWPQGYEPPKTIPAVPPTIDWNLWIGSANYRPYHPLISPYNWRGYWDYGTGALGDMGCHLLDTVVWALDLHHPISIQASSTPYNKDIYPLASIIHYDFPARGPVPPVTVTWYDGGIRPPRPSELEQGRKFGDGSGILFIGDQGKILCNTFGENARLIPEKKMKAYKLPSKSLKRSPGIYLGWIRACKGGDPPCSNFNISGPLTETVLLGNIALRIPKRKLEWDGSNLKFKNSNQANQQL